MELADTLSKLISFKTITIEQKINREALQWIRNQIKTLPITLNIFSQKGYPSLLITTRPTNKPKIILYGHIDVVEGKEKLFSTHIEKNRLYGRGAYDMKFALACYIKLLHEIGPNLSQYDFGIMIVSDEERGGFNGVPTILTKGYSTDFCLIPDGGGSENGEDWSYELMSKGVYQITVKSQGKNAHPSRPWDGENAIEKLMEFSNALKAEFIHEPCGDNKHEHTTSNLSNISGGGKSNQVPSSAEAKIDIRYYIPEINLEELKSKIEKVKSKFDGISIEEHAMGDSVRIDLDNPLVKNFLAVCAKIKGKPSEPIISHGSSDARFFYKQSIPTVLVRPYGGDLHGDNEWIDLDDLNRFYDALKTFVLENAKV